MRILIVLSTALFILSCSSEKEPEQQKQEVLIEKTKGGYKEYYPGRKQLKLKGGLDNLDRKHGIWHYYTESGVETSIINYENGLREGFSVVRYPNGSIYYRGEYHSDTMVGVWLFYDSKGKVSKEIDYGLPQE